MSTLFIVTKRDAPELRNATHALDSMDFWLSPDAARHGMRFIHKEDRDKWCVAKYEATLVEIMPAPKVAPDPNQEELGL